MHVFRYAEIMTFMDYLFDFFDSADLAEFTKENLVLEQQQTSRNGYKRPLILGINMDSFILCCQNIALPGQYDKINYCVHCI